MVRWAILITALAAWLGMMAVVHFQYGPKPLEPQAAAGREALEAVFAERAAKREAWHIYVDLSKLKPLSGAPAGLGADSEGWQREREALEREAEREGAGTGKVQVGVLVSTLKLRNETRAELATEMRLQFPKAVPDALMQAVGEIWYESRGYLSRDRGLEDFSVKASTGLGLEVLVRGYREGDGLKMVWSVFAGKDRKLLEQHVQVALAGTSAPKLDLSPFLLRPDVRVGDRWEVAVLDATSSSGEPSLAAMEVVVVRRATITYHGRPAEVFQAEAQRNRQRFTAFYAPDGRPLVQSFRFAELFDLTLVRDEEP